MCVSSNEAVTIGTPPSRLTKIDVDRTSSVLQLVGLKSPDIPDVSSLHLFLPQYPVSWNYARQGPELVADISGPLMDLCPSLILDSLPAL